MTSSNTEAEQSPTVTGSQEAEASKPQSQASATSEAPALCDPASAATITGSVRASGNGPLIASARVRLSMHDLTVRGPSPMQESVTDAQGVFTFAAAVGCRGVLSVEAEGFAPLRDIPLEMPQSQPLAIILPRCASAAGRIVNPPRMAKNESIMAAALSRFDEHGVAYDWVITSVEENNSFELTCLAPGRYRMALSRSGVMLPPGYEITLTDGQHLTGIELSASANGLRLEGVATGGQKPLPQAEVLLFPESLPRELLLQQRAPWPLAQTKTDARGSFRFDGVPGDQRYLLLLRAENHAPLVAEATTADVSARKPTTYELLPLTILELTVECSIQGSRQPAMGFSLCIAPTDRPGDCISRQFPADRAKLSDMNEGAWSLCVTAPGFAPQIIEPVMLAAGERKLLRTTLTAGSQIQGVVVRESDGSPVVGAHIRATTRQAAILPSLAGAPVASHDGAVSGKDGQFSLHMTPDSDCRIVVTHEELAGAILPCPARSALKKRLEMKLTSGGVLRVRINASDASAAGGYEMTLRDQIAQRRITVPANGETLVRGLLPGEVRMVVAIPQPDGSPIEIHQSVHVAAEQETLIETPPPGSGPGIVTLTLTDPRGAPTAPGVANMVFGSLTPSNYTEDHLYLALDRHILVHGHRKDRGVFLWRGLTQGDWRIFLAFTDAQRPAWLDNGGLAIEQDLTIAGDGTPVIVTIGLASLSKRLQGAAQGPDGAPLTDALVVVSQTCGAIRITRSVTLDRRGAFEADLLCDAPASLTARSTSQGSVEPMPVTPGTPVVLQFKGMNKPSSK